MADSLHTPTTARELLTSPTPAPRASGLALAPARAQSASTLLELTRLASLFASPEPWRISWDDLCAELAVFPQGEKSEAGVWTPTIYRHGATDRKAEHATAIGLAVLDLDGADKSGISTSELSQILTAIQPFDALVHTSHSASLVHPRVKCRVIVRLAAPVPKARWRQAWARIACALAPSADVKCADAVHAYYLPSAPPEARWPVGWRPWTIRTRGAALDPWTLPDVGPVPRGFGAPEATRRATKDDLLEVARTLRGPKWAHVGRALRAVANGDPYASEGERDEATFQAVSAVTRALPDVTPASIAELFGPSLQLMGAGAPSLESVARKAEAARAFHAETALEARSQIVGASASDLPGAASRGPLIVVSPVGGLHWIREDDRPGIGETWRGPVAGDAVAPAIRATLSAAAERGEISLIAEPDGPRSKRRRLGPKEIVGEHAVALDRIEVILGGEGGTRLLRDGSSRWVLVESAARILTPPEAARRSEVCEEYLSRLVPDDKALADLRVWLSVLPDLREPLPAIYLVGARGAGKSLLPNACARLWGGEGPGKAESLVTHWNDDILRCPLLFADETLPEAPGRADITAILRQRIQERTQTINKKYMPQLRAQGAIRLVIAANNERLLTSSLSLDPRDIGALAERFYLINCANPTEWIADHAEAILAEMPAHIRYLEQTARPTIKVNRFWIEGPSRLADQLAIRGGVRSSVCRWICEWIVNPALSKGDVSRVTPEREILLSTQDILARWPHLLPTVPIPSTTELTDALRNVTKGTRRGQSGSRLWVVDQGRIADWIEESEWNLDLFEAIGKWIQKRAPDVGAKKATYQ